jgi:hypothetical protein
MLHKHHYYFPSKPLSCPPPSRRRPRRRRPFPSPVARRPSPVTYRRGHRAASSATSAADLSSITKRGCAAVAKSSKAKTSKVPIVAVATTASRDDNNGPTPPPPALAVRKKSRRRGERAMEGYEDNKGDRCWGGGREGAGQAAGPLRWRLLSSQTSDDDNDRPGGGGRLMTWARGRLQSAVAILGMNVCLYIVNHHSCLHFGHARRLIRLCPFLHPPHH